MKVTKFGNTILWKADYYLRKSCVEKGENVVYCAGEPTKFYNASPGTKYCAAFVSQVIKDALQDIGYKLDFNFGGLAVLNLYDQAKGKIDINKTPKPGSIAIIKTGITTSKKASNGDNHSHAMLVRDVSDDFKQFWTIEGNATSNGISGVLSIRRPSSSYSIDDYSFIHIQDYFANLRTLVDNPHAVFEKGSSGSNKNTNSNQSSNLIAAVRNVWK